MNYGITFNGKHSWSDMGFTMPRYPVIEFPKKEKKLIKVPFSNLRYDMAESRGFQDYEERTIRCYFNAIDFKIVDYSSTHEVASQIANWLMGDNGLGRLELDNLPNWYFKAEGIEIPNFDTDEFEFTDFEVIFRAYPFKISTKNEGSPYWDDLTIYDYDQTIEYVLPPFNRNLKPIEVGDMVTIGGWLEAFGTSDTNFNTDYITERYRKVEEVLEDGAKYRLEGNFIVSHQNILQARTEVVPVTLYNLSSHGVKPTIEISGGHGITIVRGGEIYNIIGGLNNKFALNPGRNDLMLYGQNSVVRFIWQREVL